MEALYSRMRPLIKKFARRVDLELRRDAEQELFIELSRAVQRYRPAECTCGEAFVPRSATLRNAARATGDVGRRGKSLH